MIPLLQPLPFCSHSEDINYPLIYYAYGQTIDEIIKKIQFIHFHHGSEAFVDFSINDIKEIYTIGKMFPNYDIQIVQYPNIWPYCQLRSRTQPTNL